MTVLQAVGLCDGLVHNTCTQAQKVRWVEMLEERIHRLVLGMFVPEPEAFVPIGEDLGRELLASGPFEDMYLYWLQAQVCYSQGEFSDYNAAIAQYNRLYLAFAADYGRTHMPKSRGRFRF